MKKIVIVSIIVLLHTTAGAQVPRIGVLSMNSIGSNHESLLLSEIIPTTDGGFVLGLSSNATSGSLTHSCVVDTQRGETLFQKYDATGKIVQWEKCFTYSDLRIEYLFPVSGGWVEAAISDSSHWQPFIRKENTNGSIAWFKSYGGTGVILKDVKRTVDSGYVMLMESYYVSGDVNLGYGGAGDMFVLKLDSNGNKQWAKVIGGSGEDMPTTVIPNTDGSMYVLGKTESGDYDCTGLHSINYADGYVTRLDKQGNIKWHRDLGGNQGAIAVNGCNDGRGGIVIAAATTSVDGDVHHPIASVYGNFWIINLDSNGAILWDKSFGNTTGETFPYSICKSVDGDIYVAGICSSQGGDVYTYYGGNVGDGWIIKIDPNTGALKSTLVFGNSGWGDAEIITPLRDWSIFLAGQYYGTAINRGNLPTTIASVYTAVLSLWPEEIKSENTIISDISVYPNPAKDQFALKMSTSEYSQITVTDILGHMVYRTASNNQTSVTIQARGWPAGTYLVTCENEAGERVARKVILQ